MSLSRTEILNRLKDKIGKGQPIVGADVGTGLSAKCEETGGVDLIEFLNNNNLYL